MDPNTPVVLAAAKYATRDDAVHGFNTVWGARHEDEFDHMSLAVLTKDAHGQLQEERHDSTAKHFAWAGVALGAALCVVAPPVGVGMLAGAGVVGGAGAIVGHFWNQIPKKDLVEVSDLLESGESAIVIVAVNHKKTDITPLLSDAEKSIVIETRAGDIDTEFEKALQSAQATAN
jgi:Protein of unknown function (DUF1269)